MDSVHAMMLVGDLEDHLERRLPPTLAWTYPDLLEEEIDRLLAEQQSQSQQAGV